MNASTNPPRSNIRFEDKHIGERIKICRMVQGLTQSNVAAELGISFQQLQKYETGANRVSGSKICDLAKALRCSPAYFFEGIGEKITQDIPRTRDEALMLEHMRKLPQKTRPALLDIAKLTAQTNDVLAASVTS